MSNVEKLIRPYLDPEERIVATFARIKWHSPKGDVPAFAVITERRIVVAKRSMLMVSATTSLDLGSVVDVSTSGRLMPKVTLATSGGVALVLSMLSHAEIGAMQSAVSSARR